MRWRDEVDIMRALRLQGQKNLRKAGGRYRFSEAAVRDAFILAEHASERATREKHRSRAASAADGRLFPKMKRRAGKREIASLFAIAYSAIRAVYTAGAAAKHTFFIRMHGKNPFLSINFIDKSQFLCYHKFITYTGGFYERKKRRLHQLG